MSRRVRNLLIWALVIVVLGVGIWLLSRGTNDFRDKYEGVDLSTDVTGIGRGSTYDAYLAAHADAPAVTEEVPVVPGPTQAVKITKS